jgi:hypothetical protein
LPVCGVTVVAPILTGAASGSANATPAASSVASAPSHTERPALGVNTVACPGCANGPPPVSALSVIEPPGATTEPSTVTCSGEPKPMLAPASAWIDAPDASVTAPVTSA